MSRINISCDLASKFGNGMGEMKFPKDLTVNKHITANGVASDIVNEILENALDIAIGSSQTEESRLDCNADCTEEEITNNIRELVEGLTVTLNSTDASNTEEPVRLDIEMKRLLNEMMSPPYEIVNYDTVSRKDGVGDQPIVLEDALGDDARNVIADTENTRMVEKKTRVTDLVMNSKQVLTEILMDEESKKRQEDLEESKEVVLQVIELNCIEADDVPGLMSKRGVNDSAISGISGDDEEESFTPIPKDDMLDLIDLTSSAFKEEEQKLSGLKGSNHGGKGDEFKNVPAESMIPRSSKSLPSPPTPSEHEFSNSKKDKKKKWNFGNRLWGYFKKRTIKNHGQQQAQQNKNIGTESDNE